MLKEKGGLWMKPDDGWHRCFNYLLGIGEEKNESYRNTSNCKKAAVYL